MIRRSLHRFLARGVEEAGADWGVLIFVAVLPVDGPISLFAVEVIDLAVVARFFTSFLAVDEGYDKRC